MQKNIKEIFKRIIPLKNRIYYFNLFNFYLNKKNAFKVEKLWIENGKKLPVPHVVKQKILKEYAKKNNIDTLFETGTYLGDMLIALRSSFKELYSIELSEDCYKLALTRCSRYKNIFLHLGDSSKLMVDILNKINRPTLFWLDGHYSDGITALGEKRSPVLEEISQIFKSNVANLNNVILIDDAVYFTADSEGYPTVDELTKHIHSFDNEYKVEIVDNIIVCTKNSQE